MIPLGVFSHQYVFHWAILCTLKEFSDTFHAMHGTSVFPSHWFLWALYCCYNSYETGTLHDRTTMTLCIRLDLLVSVSDSEDRQDTYNLLIGL